MAAPTFVSGAALSDGLVAGTYVPLAAADLSNCAVAIVQVGLTADISGATINIDTGTTAGWTKLGQQQVTSGNAVSAVFYRIAPTATETLNITSSDTSATWTSEIIRVSGANSVAGTSSPGSRNPPSYDAGAVRDYLWLEMMIAQTAPSTSPISGASSGYSNLTANSGNSPALGAATKDGTASQVEDPGTWTGGVAPRNASWTIALWQGSTTTPISCQASTAPVATAMRSNQIIRSALGAATATVIRATAKPLNITTSLIATAKRAVTKTMNGSTAPVAASGRSTSRFLQAVLGVEERFGPEIIYNGAIGPAADGWTLSDGATASGDGRIHFGNGVINPIATPTVIGGFESGSTYELVYAVSDYTSGNVRGRLQTFFTLRSSDGTFTERKTISTNSPTFNFASVAATNDLYLDNFSLRQVITTPATLSLQTLKNLTASAGVVAALSRIMGKLATAATQLVGSTKHDIAVARQGIASVAASLQRATSLSHSGSASAVASATPSGRFARSFQAEADAVASLLRATAIQRAASATTETSIRHDIAKSVQASASSTASLQRATSRSFSAQAAAIASRVISVGHFIAVAVTAAAALVRSSTKSGQAGANATASLVRVPAKQLAATSQAGATLSRLIGLIRSAETAPVGSVAKETSHIESASTAPEATLRRAINRSFSATAGAVSSLFKSSARRLFAIAMGVAHTRTIASDAIYHGLREPDELYFGRRTVDQLYRGRDNFYAEHED